MKKFSSYLIYAILIACIACSCSDDINIRSDYEFKVTHLPVPKKLKVGQVAEIRCQLERSGRYEDTKYYLRYFQSEGQGSLKIGDSEPLLPNDTYEVTEETFRLYYESESSEQAEIEIVFFDSSGYEYPLLFRFNSDNSKED